MYLYATDSQSARGGWGPIMCVYVCVWVNETLLIHITISMCVYLYMVMVWSWYGYIHTRVDDSD
jgi:hypothetical protein